MPIDYQKLREDAETGDFFRVYFEIDLHEWAKQNKNLLTELELQKIEQAQKTKIKPYGKNSRITTENWEQRKETFFAQRMANITYKDSYTYAERIKLELLRLEELTINKTDYQILKDRYKAYLLEKQALPPQKTEKTKPEWEAPKTFDELFYNIELVQQSIDVLKEIEPPLIDTDYNYIGKLKGIICVWIDELQRQGIVKYYSDRKIFASLIPQKIKRFSIDESMFGKYHTKAENNYRTAIKTKVSKIKLSQNSQ